jgi:tRNA-dihydrouridine synthase
LKPVTINEIVDLAKIHFQKSVKYKGEPRGVYEMRRHFSTYFRGLPDFKKTRIRLLTTLDVNEITGILDEIAGKYGEVM